MSTARSLLIVLALPFLLVPIFAQRTGSLQAKLFAIRDARVVVEPGKILDRATVVIRDGLIESVGPEAAIPAGAIVIDGKGKTLYAGFLDAGSTWGYDASLRRSETGPAATEDLAGEALAATKPDNRKGITPEFQTATALQGEAETADAWRKAGVTARLVAPEGGFFSGQSSLVSLSGSSPRETILRAAVGQHLSFRPIGGSDYPRVLMGVVAHCRQTLLDAGHYQRQWQRFGTEGIGKRPPYDPALAELGALLDRKLPVILEADTRDEIHRTLDFAKEFNLQPILLGGRHAGKVVDRLKGEKVPVILRLNVGESRNEGDEATKLPERAKQEQERLAKLERETAKVLAEAGVRIAFASTGLSGDKPWEKYREQLRKVIEAGLPPEAALKALTSDAAEILGAGRQMGRVAAGRPAHLILTDGDFHRAETQVYETFADGVRFSFDVKPKEKKPEPEKKPEEKKPEPEKADRTTEIETDRLPKVRTKGHVVIRGATLLTVGPQGNLAGMDLYVKDGKIAAIGKNLPVPTGAATLDAAGMFVMPGIIDTHSHFAVSGGVNEFSLSIVPEVRIRDVLNSEDAQIYRALGGGVTMARLLHGSANVIGGQDGVLKMKYGEPASAMLMTGGPRGVKFALGENVKRTDGRFPNTRLGVEAVLIRAFSEAQAYARIWDTYRKEKAAGKNPDEPRRDLRLEALAEVLTGEIKVHCHCYRSDEILMLLRVADRFGIKIQSLQHVLEGYKIAPEIAAHGASCSLFSDWWAYKIEAFEAIPYAAALIHQAGGTICLKSDSNELMRHLYQEAAKLVKYGGLSEQDALKAITLNCAKQLGLEKRLGSIEIGKDADLAIFTGHPLNSFSRCEATLIDGEVYFLRGESQKLKAFAPAASFEAKPAATLPPVAISPAGRYLIRSATVHPVSGESLSPRHVLIEKGRIAQIFQPGMEAKLPGDTVVIDGKGLHLYPGMIDAATVLGLTELGSARETQDFAEGGDFQPDLRASVGINPDSELIPVTRANGITSVVTRPTGSLIAGQAALINLAGWVPREMAVVDPLGLSIEFPVARPTLTGDPIMPAIGRIMAKKQREEKIRRLRELFAQATAHDEAKKQNPNLPANPRLEALIPYARGEKPVMISANRAPEILEALKLADEMKWKIVLTGGIDAWKVADELKKRDIPVILGPIMTMPQESHDRYDAPFTAAAKLHDAGIRFCIRSVGTMNVRNLPYEAAMAVSYGLPPEEGLKAVTLNVARILGVEKELGSIEPGKRANLILTTGNPLQVTTQTVLLFIDGKPIAPTSKHTRLYERYQERLKEVQSGQAPLGTK